MPRDSAHRIDPSDILAAYGLGYFPMARSRDAASVVWVLPDDRGAMQLSEARAPKKLLRFLSRTPFAVTADKAFHDVILACAEAGPGREDTWINDPIIEAYTELHFLGRAHSIECWRDGALVGGLYGVALGGVFCGESMFSRADNASKIAMLHLIARLKIGGFTVLDAQFQTDHLAQFGVTETPNEVYQKMLANALMIDGDFKKAGPQLSSTAVRQSITQTS